MTDEELFSAALRIQTSADRLTYLDEACGTDTEQRARVGRLLAALDDAGSFLNKPVVELPGIGPTMTPHGQDGSAIHEPVRLDFLSPSTDPDSLGSLGPYHVQEVIGRGGMGIVLRATDPKLNRVVAIKVLAPEFHTNPVAVKRFLREAQAAAAVTHDHIVRIYAVDDTAKVPYLVMECIVGQSLQQKIERKGILEVREILRIGHQIASGLAAAHKQGLVHRDIKPANILLENGIERVKITDFGLARAVDDAGITQSGQVTGTPQYMSPEQAMGETVDHRSDLFSLGSVLYTMCTGRPAFRATSTVAVLRRVVDDAPRPIAEINPDAPDWLTAIVGRLMSKRPEDRFQTAGEVATVLEQWLAHIQRPQAIPAPPRIEAIQNSPTVTVERPGVLRQAWDEWWAERDRWFAVCVQLVLLALHLTCMLIFLRMSSTTGTENGQPTLDYTVGFPSPWFQYAVNRGGQLGFRWSFNVATWSMLIGLIGYLFYLAVWRIETARSANATRWMRPGFIMSCWGFGALVTIGMGFGLGGTLAFSNRAQIARVPSQTTQNPEVAERMTLLKRLDPATDKPVPPAWDNDQDFAQVQDGAWRIENKTGKGNFNVLMATVLDHIPRDGILVYRAKVKVEATDPQAWGDLMLGDRSPDMDGYQWPSSKYTFRGNITEWTQQEVRYPAKFFAALNPPQARIYVGLHANGVLWVKDVELWHLPESPASSTPQTTTSSGDQKGTTAAIAPVDFNGIWASGSQLITLKHPPVTNNQPVRMTGTSQGSQTGVPDLEGELNPKTRTFEGLLVGPSSVSRVRLVLSADGNRITGFRSLGANDELRHSYDLTRAADSSGRLHDSVILKQAWKQDWVGLAAIYAGKPLTCDANSRPRLSFKDNEFVLIVPGIWNLAGTYRLEETESPRRLIVDVPNDGQVTGLYELNGRFLRIALGRKEDKVSGFKSPADSHILVADFEHKNSQGPMTLITVRDTLLERGNVVINRGGNYEVKFTQPFADAPSVIFPVEGDEWPLYSRNIRENYAAGKYSVGKVTASGFELTVTDFKDAPRHPIMRWQAEGPPALKPTTVQPSEGAAVPVSTKVNPAPAPKSEAILKELREQIEQAKQDMKLAQARKEQAQGTHVEVLAAEGRVVDGELRLLQAEGKSGKPVIEAAQKLVRIYEDQVEMARRLYQSGRAEPDLLNRASKELSEARIRLLELQGENPETQSENPPPPKDPESSDSQ